MFYGCELLKSLPNISILNTGNLIEAENMFFGCTSLKSLPDISNWKIKKKKEKIVNGIFNYLY